jgi:cytochrome c oxidase subunit 2
MLAGAAGILGLVLGILAWAFWKATRETAINERRWLIGGGIAFPSVTLLALLAYALITGERVLVPGSREAPVVTAVARQFAWEFRYADRPGSSPSPVLAIPVGRPVDVRVTSTDVIHSFWVPRLAGKIDAIPGHVNIIRISADRPGVYRGQCSEFCGTGHATMDFRVEALTEEEFSRFLAASEIQQDSGFWQEGRP